MSKTHLDGVFADTQSVPQLDGLVPRARYDLAVISREGDAQDVLGVPDKAAGCGSPRKRGTGVKTGARPKLLTDQSLGLTHRHLFSQHHQELQATFKFIQHHIYPT